VRGNLKYLWLKNKGVTLIELLIVLVISSILIAALYRVFISQQKTYTVQDQVTDMQQNARQSINRMMSEIRMAGFGNVSMVLPVTFGAKTFNNVVNPDAPVASSLTIICAIQGGATITQPATPNSNQIKVSSLDDFDITKNPDKKYISIGGLESHVISAVDTNQKIITLNDTIIYNHLSGTLVFPIRAISYQVVSEELKFTLKRDENIGGGRQPLADNIKDIQFQYLDANGNETATPASIRMVRATVTATTAISDDEYKDRKTIPPKRTIASNIYLRNMGLSP
jgi:prepilin-type N-terminal cleavage/methylation domain-containing protein